MPEMPEHRTVWLVHALPQGLAVRIIALRQVEGDDPVQMTSDDLAVGTGEQIERQAGETVADHDRQLELIESEDQPAFRGFGHPVLRKPYGVRIGWSCSGQPAAEAQAEYRRGICDPVTSATIEVRTDRAAGGDSHQGALLPGVSDR